MVTNFKKSFLLLITAIFFTQSLILGCSTEVDSEVKKMEEEKPDVITVVKKTYSVQGIPESWATTDVYAYAYDDNGNKILIPVTVQNGVATFEADETYTKCVLVSLPKGTDVSAYTANPASILSADCQKSEVIDLTKDSLSFVLVESDYIGTWNSLTDKLVINEEGTFSLDIGNDDSVDYAGTYVDTKTGVKVSYSEKVDGTDVSKTLEFTKKESDVLVGTIHEKETYFVKASTETPNLNGTWKNSDETTTTIINNESKKIYVKVGETEIWGTIVQKDNMFILQDEESNVIGTGFVSAAGNAYIYNEATGTYEIFTRNGSATESDSKIPYKKFTVTYKSEFAEDDVQEKAEGTVLELQTPSHKGYRFDGWYTNAEKTAKAEATYTIAENLTFYAKWVQQVTVKFTSAQSEHADKVVDIGTEITIEDPAKEKFDFDGWYDGETKVSGKYTVTKDVELIAKWTALYNVTFETAGGSPVDSLENVRAGTKITLDEAKWDGYEFEWWAAEGKTFVKDAEYTVNSDVIFVAKWAGLCTVVYNTDGGSSVESKTVHAMETIQMPAAPTKDGYRFLGWYTTDENNLMQPDDVFNVTDSVTINAKWVKLYTYKYDNTEYVTVEEGTKITIDDAPEAEGCTFAGWSDGTNTYQPGYEYEITSNVEFTAIWNVTVTFVSEHTEHEEVTIEKGSTLDLPNPTVEEYDFDGWFNEGDEKFDSSYTVDANITLTAKWTKLWTVTYMSDGVEIGSEIVRDGESIVLKAPSIEKTGHTFYRWLDGEVYKPVNSSIEITADITLTALWEKIPVTYTISGVPTTGWGLVEVYVYNEAEGRENGEFLGTNDHAVNGEGNITFETAKDITHCILVSFGEFDPNSEMPSYGDLEQLLNVSYTYSEDLNVTSGSAVFVQYVPKVTYTIKNAEGYSTPYVTIDGEEVASVYDSETKTVTFEYAEGLTGCLIAKDDSHSAEKEIIFDENGIGMINSQYSFVIDPNQVYFRNSKNWHGGIQVYAWHSSDSENKVRIDMTKAADTDQWYYADMDYTLYDTVYFAGQTTNNTNDNGETVQITLDKSKIFYRPSDNRDSSLGKDSGGRDKFNVMNFEKINDYAPGFN
ncbi:MAG: InlB B-repeat-containing protein [Treponema sp.]|nr:InlB B-repeat-containing protein [Treponema sp.]